MTSGNKLLGGFASTFVLIVAISLLSAYYSRQKVVINHQIAKANLIIREAALISSLTKDIESGQREYFITSDSNYLEHAVVADGAIFQHIATLKELTVGEPDQQARIDSLKSLVEERIAFYHHLISLRNENNADEATGLMKTRQGKFYADKIRNLEAKIHQWENERLLEFGIDIGQTDTAFNRAFAFFFLSVFTLLIVMFQGIRNEMNTRKKAEASLVKLNSELEEKVKERTEKLVQSELLYRSLFANMMHGFIYCQALYDKRDRAVDYLYLAANERYSELTGLRDLVGRKVSEVVPGLTEADPALFETIGRVSITGRPEIFETFIQQLDQWYAVSMYCPHPGHFVALVDNITDRKKVEIKLAQSELLYRSLFENMMHGFVYCQVIFDENRRAIDHVYLAANSRYSELTGLKDLIGRKSSEVVPGQKESSPALFDAIGRVSTTGKPETFETFTEQLNQWFTVSLYCPQPGYFVALVDNVSDRKRTEIKLTESEHRFRAMLENSSDAILLQDTDLNVFYQSPATDRITGITMKHRLANPGVRFTHPVDEPEVQLVIRQSRQFPGKPLPFQTRILHVDGHYIWVEGTITNLLDEPGVMGILSNYRDVTDRKKSDDQQALFSSIVNSSDDAIISKALDGTVTSWNDGAEKLFGYSEEEILGKDEFLIIARDRPEEHREISEKLARGEKIDHQETIRVRKDGSQVHVSITASPLKDVTGNIIGSSKIVRDISERWAHAEKLAASEQRFRALIEHSTEGLTLYDENMYLFYQSPGAVRMLGWELEERRVHPISYFIHENDMESFGRLFGNVKNTPAKPFPFQLRFRHKDGDYVWIEGVLTNLLHEPSVAAIAANFRDIDARKEAEAWKEKQKEELELEVIKRTQELSVAKYAAEEANLTKGQFLANMSHEIRTPLNAVIGLSHLAMKTQLTPKQDDYLQKIHSSSESLLGIINDILDFSKMEAGKLTLEEVSFDLEEVLQKLADVITYKAHSKNLEIAFGVGRETVTRLIGDPIRLQQVLNNLCSNAIKFTEKGEVVVTTKLIEDEGHEVVLQFEVSDTGIGMTKADMDKLFTPFTQADDSISRKFGGTGLGLSIIKLLVELMKGTVWVDSMMGKGSKFYFTARFGKQKQQHKVPVPLIDLQKLNVLLVEDNESSLKLLKEALESLSFEVTGVRSGSRAISFLKENHARKPVSLILMDWSLPEMDGMQAAEIIRRDERFKAIRIIMLCTSYANEDVYFGVDKLGLDGILTKPIKYSILHDTIINAFKEEGKKQRAGRRSKRGAVYEQIDAHVLLVEDNEINQQVSSELLMGFGYSVDIAANGLEALNKVKASGSPSKYDIVFMDLQMPIMGGYKATTEIRNLQSYVTLPIIAMTADAMDGVKKKCLEAGMMDFITKPIDPNRVLAVLQKWSSKPPKEVNLADGKNITQAEHGIPDLKGIDIEDGLKRLNGNGKLYSDLLIRFHEEQKNFIEEVIKELTRGETALGHRLVHTLKGTSANLGMLKLHKSLVSAEKELKIVSTKKEITKILLPVKNELEYILDSLEKLLIKKSIAHHAISLDVAKPLLDELDKLLEKQDLEAIRVLEKLGVVRGHEKQIEDLKLAAQDFDFEKARKILQALNVDA